MRQPPFRPLILTIGWIFLPMIAPVAAAHPPLPSVRYSVPIDRTKPDLGLPSLPHATTQRLYTGVPTPELGAYSHHSHLAFFNGILVASWSNHWLDEDAPGQYVRFSLSRDLGETWTDPTSPAAVLFPPMDAARQNTDRRYDKSKEFYTMCANGYAVVDSVLYAIAEPSRGINNPGIGRVARAVGTDGKLGPVFWLNSPHETPHLNQDAYQNPTHAALGPIAGRILESLRDPRHMPQWDFFGWPQLDGRKVGGWAAAFGATKRLQSVTEPTYAYEMPDGTYARFWRTHAGTQYVHFSLDRGLHWSDLENTDFPDGGSRSNVGNLPDGTAYVINNPVERDPLTLALARDGRTFSAVALINQGAGQNRHPGRAKIKGYQYPHAVVGGGFLFVLYSANKEDICFTKIPLDDISALLRTRR